MFERVRQLSAPALLLAVLALSTAAPAAASPDDVVRDCADDGNVEIGDHSRSDLRKGRDQIPADLDAYSDCRAQIGQALDRPRAGAAVNNGGFPGGDGTGSGGGGDGSAGPGRPLTEEQQVQADERKRELARAQTESLLGDRSVNPATAGALEQAETTNGLSLALLLAIIALVLALGAGALVALRRHNPELYAGTVGRVRLPRGLDSLSPLRRRR